MNRTTVVLVDAFDNEIGTAEKLSAHRTGALHRAFSVFIFDTNGRMLLQQRARGKYHSGGLWSNACCSHPESGDDIVTTARERLQEEMGIDCPLKEIFTFTYRAAFDNGLIEHELDHVLTGVYDIDPIPNPAEADAWRWVTIPELREEVKKHPELFTIWFAISLEKVLAVCYPDSTIT